MKGTLQEYIEEKRANGIKESSIGTIKWTLESLNKKKSLEKCTEKDLKKMLSELDCTEKTKSLYQVYVKNFFKWRGESEKITWIKVRKIKTHIREDDLLKPDEIKSMLETCTNPRESALISILSESAGRISEIMSLNINDLSNTDYGFKMRIRDGKTGARDIALISSVPHIIQWLNIHPLRKDNASPLFVNQGSREHFERMTARQFRKILKTIAKDAGITRRVHPHLFRHSTLTNMASDGMQESVLRRLAGWAGASEMPEVYIHVGNKDVEQAQLARHGKATALKHLSQSPLTKECPNCHKDMPIEAQYCDNCSKHQDLSKVVKRLLEEHQHTMANIADETIIRSKLSEDFETTKEVNKILQSDVDELKKSNNILKEYVLITMLQHEDNLTLDTALQMAHDSGLSEERAAELIIKIRNFRETHNLKPIS